MGTAEIAMAGHTLGVGCCLVLLGALAVAQARDVSRTELSESELSLIQTGKPADGEITPQMLIKSQSIAASAQARLKAEENRVVAAKLKVAEAKRDVEAHANDAEKKMDKQAVLEKAEAHVKKLNVALEKHKKAYEEAAKRHEKHAALKAEQDNPGCHDKWAYKRLCAQKKQLCKDKDYSKVVQEQCPKTCNVQPDSCP